MTKKEKLLSKFLQNPQNTKLSDILKILVSLGFTTEKPVGDSHWKAYNHEVKFDIPEHRHDTKLVYKKQIVKYLKTLKIPEEKDE